MSLFEYALLRVVPRVERGEFINAGVVLYCQDAKFLDARVHLDPERLRALDPGLDPETVLAHLEVARRVCAGRARGRRRGPATSRASASGGSSRPAAPWCSPLRSTRASPTTPRKP